MRGLLFRAEKLAAGLGAALGDSADPKYDYKRLETEPAQVAVWDLGSTKTLKRTRADISHLRSKRMRLPSGFLEKLHENAWMILLNSRP